MTTTKKQSDTNESVLSKALEVLDTVNLTIEVQGEPMTIRHFRWLECGKITQLLHENAESIPWEIFNMNYNEDTEQMTKGILKCMSQCAEVVLDIIKIHLNKDDAWAELLEIDEVIKIMLAIVKANANFFQQTLLPLTQTIQSKLAS